MINKYVFLCMTFLMFSADAMDGESVIVGQRFNALQQNEYYKLLDNKDRLLVAHCPNHMRSACIDTSRSELSIFVGKITEVYRQDIKEIPEFFAVSPITTSIAFIRSLLLPGPKKEKKINALVVKNFTLNREHFFELNYPDFVPCALSYDKIGTNVFVYGIMNGKKYFQPFSLHHREYSPLEEDI
jgi:hypothetical protein